MAVQRAVCVILLTAIAGCATARTLQQHEAASNANMQPRSNTPSAHAITPVTAAHSVDTKHLQAASDVIAHVAFNSSNSKSAKVKEAAKHGDGGFNNGAPNWGNGHMNGGMNGGFNGGGFISVAEYCGRVCRSKGGSGACPNWVPAAGSAFEGNCCCLSYTYNGCWKESSMGCMTCLGYQYQCI